MTEYMPEETFVALCDKVNLDPLDIKYKRRVRGIVFDTPTDFTAYDFEMIVPAGKKYSIVRVTWYSESVPHMLAMDFKGRMPLSLSVSELDFEYSWRGDHGMQD